MYQNGFLYKLIKLYDKLIVFLYCQFVFNRSLSVRQQTIERFGDTEDDTVWQLFWGIHRIKDQKIQAVLFQQIVEETYHAEEFYTTLKKMGTQRSSYGSYERRSLYGPNEPIWKLILYCHVGEAEAEMRFRNFLNYSCDGVEKRAIGKVLADEVGHVSGAFDILNEMGIQKEEIDREIKSIFWRRRKESVLFFFKRIGGFFLDFIFSIVYFALGPFVKSSCKKRLSQSISNPKIEFKEVTL